MELLVLGISHNTAPVALRERLALTERAATRFVTELVAREEVEEAVAISTCNRTEIYLVTADPVRAEAYRSLGLETICRTLILAGALSRAAIEGAESTDGQVQPPTAEPMRGAPAAGTKAAKKAEDAVADTVDAGEAE